MEVIQLSVFLLVISQSTLAATSKVAPNSKRSTVRMEGKDNNVRTNGQSALISSPLLHPTTPLSEKVVPPLGLMVPSTKRNNPQHEDNAALSETNRPSMFARTSKPEMVGSKALSLIEIRPPMVLEHREGRDACQHIVVGNR